MVCRCDGLKRVAGRLDQADDDDQSNRSDEHVGRRGKQLAGAACAAEIAGCE
jgi:hypothetical protein